jgi:hypothetical protein
MKNIRVLFIFIILLSFLVAFSSVEAQTGVTNDPIWISADQNSRETSDLVTHSYPIKTNTIDVTIVFPGVWAEIETKNGEDFTKLWHDEYGSYREPGQPALPGKTFNILIPNGAQVEVLNQTFTSKKIHLSDYALPTTIIPAQIQVSKSEPPPPWSEPDPKHYGNPNVFPQNWYELKDTFQMRDYTILPVWINPVRYSPGKGEIEILKQIELQLTWQASSLDGVKSAVVSDSPSFDRLVSQIVINPPDLPAYDTKEATGEGYLIITPDLFYDELQPFVDLTENQGYVVEVTLLSEIEGFVGSMESEINDILAIQEFINKLDPPPVYLLLVGDTNLIPAPTGDVTKLKTDLYYATLGKEDYVPDIHIGRLPARSIADLSIILDNILSYTNDGYQDWHLNSSFIATCDNNYDHHLIAESTHEEVIDLSSYYLFFGNFPYDEKPSGGDKLYCVSNFATEEDVITNINLERGLITYSGHGMQTAWYDIDTDWDSDDNIIARREITISSDDVIKKITTLNVHPFVSSFACLTNDFGSSSYPIGFGETWMLQENKGSVGYFGSAAPSYWNQDKVLELNMFDYLFSNPLSPPSAGEAIEAGLLSLQNEYSDITAGGFQYYLESYNLLGDPSQKLWLYPDDEFFFIAQTSDYDKSGLIGSTITYSINLTNYGETDSYNVEIQNNLWPTIVSEVNEVPTKTSVPLTISVQIPLSALPNDTDQVEITITSTNSDQTTSFNFTTTAVGTFFTHLPLVFN